MGENLCGRGSKWKVVDVRGKEPSQRTESRTSGFAVPSASLTRRAGCATSSLPPIPIFHSQQTSRAEKELQATKQIDLRVCLKRDNPQVRVDFSSVQGRNPKA